ncbi:hypothetical protein B0H66DRAFT_590333 [Apodospora peruviana]|uniref:Heterokaryon incompatibility domain-containing protein n=1 Tax=Apodospora peruviana TaxID=516989 RepID=A0AAE0ICH4_9PEZI|nr:hypothetical protein B0H66DRAFT_590333 [Apodospora peruviana]
MDFLPHPSRGVEPLDIPFVADTPYIHGGNFWDFPKTHGFGGRWPILPAARLASLAQSWLYFGTISEFLGRPIDYREFQRFLQRVPFDDHPAASSVTGKPLQLLLVEWRRQHVKRNAEKALALTARIGKIGFLGGNRLSGADDDDWIQAIYRHAEFLDKVFDLAEDFEELSQGHIYPIPAIVLSVKVLCITLSNLLGDLLYELPAQWPKTALRRPNGKASSLPSTQLLLDVLQIRRWCPFQVGKITSSYNYALAYYFTRLFPKFPSEPGHKRCSETGCVASNIDLTSYEPKHTEPSCQCRQLSVRADEIRAIILGGGIPVVKVTASRRKKDSIKAVSMTPGTRVVAFSHVWSDGLGNTRTNGLPKCQLRRLQEYADRSGSYQTRGAEIKDELRSKYFWIDTLCVPVGGLQDEARIQAINKTAAVFQAADRVLVLDQSMDKISLATTDICEQFARLSVSPWMGRCWTFQEAALSSVCHVQCADGTFDLLSGHNQSQTSQSRQFQSLPGYLRSAFPSILTKRFFETSAATSPLLEKSQRQEDATKAATADLISQMSGALARPLEAELQSAFAKDISGTKTPTDLCTLFVHTWNELSKRSTTTPQDKNIIMANLMNFNLQPVLQLSNPGDSMSAILASMDGLPVSLFLNLHRTPREKPGGYHRNRWVPLHLSKQKLRPGSRYSNIRSVNSELHFPNNTISRREASVLIICPGQEKQPLSLSTGFQVRDSSSDKTYSVKVHRAGEDDAFASPDITWPYCIAIQHDQRRDKNGDTLSGALFRIQTVNTTTHSPIFTNNSYTSLMKMEYNPYESSFVTKSTTTTPSGVQLEFPDKELMYGGGGAKLDTDLSLALAQRSGMGGVSLRVVYDCPITVSRVQQPELSPPSVGQTSPFNFGWPLPERDDDPPQPAHGNPDTRPSTFTAVPLPTLWQMVIEKEPSPKTLVSRTPSSYRQAMTAYSPLLSTTFFCLTALDGLVASGSVGLCMALVFTAMAQGLLAPLAQAAIVMILVIHCASLIRIFLADDPDSAVSIFTPYDDTSSARKYKIRTPVWIWNVLHLVLVGMFTASRVTSISGMRRRTGLTVLDMSFIWWGFVGHAVDLITKVVVIKYFVLSGLWDRYLKSFDDEITTTAGIRITGGVHVGDDDGASASGGWSPLFKDETYPPQQKEKKKQQWWWKMISGSKATARQSDNLQRPTRKWQQPRQHDREWYNNDDNAAAADDDGLILVWKHQHRQDPQPTARDTMWTKLRTVVLGNNTTTSSIVPTVGSSSSRDNGGGRWWFGKTSNKTYNKKRKQKKKKSRSLGWSVEAQVGEEERDSWRSGEYLLGP